jgi:hypothetical protein
MRHAEPFALPALLALLAGCATEIPLGEPDLAESDVLAQAETLRRPLTTRQQVHDALGAPALAAPDGSAEVFHVTARQQQLALVMMFPLPGFSLRHEAYTLVAYDAGGAVAEVESAYRRNEFGDIRQGVVLRAGDYEFVHAQADLLLVVPERYLAMQVAREAGCTVFMGCARQCSTEAGEHLSQCGVCWTRLQVDDGPIQEFPLLQMPVWRLEDDSPLDPAAGPSAAESRCQELGGRLSTGSGRMCILSRYSLAPLQLAPGRHRFLASSKSLDGEARGELDCAAGKVVYAALDGEVTERYSFSRQLGAGLRTGAATGRITFSADAPPGLQGQNVILNW